MAFKRQHKKVGGRKPGGKNKKTILLESMGITKLEDFKTICLTNIYFFLTHENDQLRYQATKEITKYVFAKVTDPYYDPDTEELPPY